MRPVGKMMGGTKKKVSLLRTVLILAIIAIPLSGLVNNARADYGWNSSQKTTLSETTLDTPAIVYSPSQNKAFLSWTGTDSKCSMNVISSSDMITWSNKNTLGYSVGACLSIDRTDMTYNPDNQYMYLVFPVGTNPTYLYITRSQDGASWPKIASINIGNFGGGESITYDTVNKQLVIAKIIGGCAVVPTGCVSSSNMVVYKSTDGGTGSTWDQGTIVTYNGNPPSASSTPEIRFFNGKYFFTYNAYSDNHIHVMQSTDASTWTSNIDTGEWTHASVGFGYNPVESRYHILFQAADTSGVIYDKTSSDGVNWGNKVTFQSTQAGPAVTYFSSKDALLLAWMGTDLPTSCYLSAVTCASVNTMPQNIPISASAFVATGGATPTMCAGQQLPVTVTMNNIGSTTWLPASSYPSNPFRLGSQNPQDNNYWGFGRVDLSQSVGPGASATFSFTVTAPSAPGIYNFQWQMVQDGVTWFGDKTSNTQVTVSACSLSVSSSPSSVPADGTSSSTITIQTSNNHANVLISTYTNLGTLSGSSCTTGTGGSCTVTITSRSYGTAMVTAIATGYNSGSTTVAFTDFSISASPATQTVNKRATASFAVVVSSINGMSGTVSLGFLVPAAVSCSISPGSVSVPPSPGTATISCSSSSVGEYSVSVTGTSGSITHSTSVLLIVGLSLYFRDNLTYGSTIQMTTAGWSLSTPSHASVGGGLLTLVNDQSVGSQATWSNVPSGVGNWTIALGAEWVGGSYGTLQLDAWTAHHSYVWHADGYYNQYIFYRDGQIVLQINGYTPQLNVWHTLRIDMRGGVLSLYFDGKLITTYTETDPGTAMTQYGPAAGWGSTDSYNFIEASAFSFHDDFSYSSISAMGAAGWSVTTPAGYAGYASVSGGLLTLVNDGSRAASATWTSVPSGVSDWTISSGEEWVGGSYGTLQLNTWTARHSYVWHGDGYYNQYIFYRDGQIISRINGYAPQMNVWHTLRMDMSGGVLSLYFDGSLITTYTETDPSTSLTQFGPAEGWMSTVSFDFIQAARIDTSRFDFGLSASPTSVSFNSGSSASSTLTLNSLTGSSGTVSLVALVSSPGLTVSFNPATISIGSSGSATSTITFSSSTPGTYYVTLTVSDGIQFHSATIVVTVH